MFKKIILAGYLSMILYFILWFMFLVFPGDIEKLPVLLLAIIDFFAWLGFSIYLLKNKETRIHGIILLVIWLILIVLIAIGLYFSPIRQWHSSKICGSWQFSENLASNLNDAIDVLETKYGHNITTIEATTEVQDKNGEWVTKTIYFISIPYKGPAALDSNGNLYYQLLC